MEKIRVSTATAPPPPITSKSSSELQAFTGTSVNELCHLIADAPNKQCELDPITTWLLKECSTDLAPFLMDMFNKSLCSGEVSMALKTTIVTPILKKPNLDVDDLAKYRPVSKLSFISKLLEKVIVKRLSAYLYDNKLIPRHQSVYRRFQSIETALLRVLLNLTSALKSGKLPLLSLLDMSAAFDTVDHEILLRRLDATYGIQNGALMWIVSYLSDRTEKVHVKGYT